MREWKAKGVTDRDWTKLKVIYIDDNGKPRLMKNDDYKRMLKDDAAAKCKEAAAACKDKNYLKKAR